MNVRKPELRRIQVLPDEISILCEFSKSGTSRYQNVRTKVKTKDVQGQEFEVQQGNEKIPIGQQSKKFAYQ